MRLRLVAAAVMVLVVFAACGGGAGNPLAAITLAAARTSDAGTARMTSDMTMTIQGQTIRSTGEGELDLANELSHLTMTMEGVPGAGVVETEMYASGFTMYMRSDSFGVSIPGAKEWVEIDLQAAGEEAGFDLGAFRQLGSNDPTASLDYLRGAKSVEEVGSEEIRGTRTTHYRATIEWDSVVDEVPEDTREAMRANVDLITEWTGETEHVFDVWLDEEGRMRRMTMAFDYVTGPAAGSSIDMTMEMFDFGTDVAIELPDPSTVTPFEEVMERAQG